MEEMKNQFRYPCLRPLEAFVAVLSVVSLSSLVVLCPSYAQSGREGDLPQEREIQNTFSRDQKNGKLFDATNPMDFINRLRIATAMDNATSPSDAIDDALKALDSQELEDYSSDLMRNP